MKKKGKLHQTYIDGMEEQLTVLSIMTNALIYWNTLYLGTGRNSTFLYGNFQFVIIL